MRPNTKIVACTCILAIAGSINTTVAQSLRKTAKRAEKSWAVAHPFIAAGTYRHTREALDVIRNSRGRFGLDTAQAEGTYDAFRHGYWMAYLSQRYKTSKVLALGEAHEKSNYRAFLNGEKEHGVVPDKANSDMDLWNNKKGAEIGKKYPKAGRDSLQLLILEEIRAGSFRVIKKDREGNYLDCNGNIIPPEKLKGTWENPKCLSPSSVK